MVTELIVAILMIAAMPVFAQAQKSSAADRDPMQTCERSLKLIKGDKAKTDTCRQNAILGHEPAAVDEKQADERNQKTGESEKKLGSEHVVFTDGFRDIDLGTEVGQEMGLMFCGRWTSFCGGK